MIDFGKLMSRFKRKVDLSKEFNAFKDVFGSPKARETVLPILMNYTGLCTPAPEGGGAFAQGRAAGRRDVMLLIQYYVNLTEKDIFDMVKSNPLKPEDLRNAR